MTQSQSTIIRRLTQALQDKTPITVHRDGLDWDETSGFVVALTHDWVVLHELDGVYLNEVVLLRLDLVTNVNVLDANETAYLRRALSGLDQAVENFDCPPNASISDLFRIVDERAELVGVHLESPDGDWINIGKIIRLGTNRIDLQFIGRDGVWADFVDAWKLTEITRIEFGGGYIAALERFGAPRPPIVERKKR